MPDHDTTAARIDQALAAVLRGEAAAWPEHVAAPEQLTTAMQRIAYHGIAGLLAVRPALIAEWPATVVSAIREEALARAMWEIRHRMVLDRLLRDFAAHGVEAVILKGTALAYDLYENPATRGRSDTDLLVAPGGVDAARQVLRDNAFAVEPLTDGTRHRHRLQELWNFSAPDGSVHSIDLHWQAMNAPALAETLSLSDCMASRRSLPRLGPEAWTMDHVALLAHTALHRAAHLTSPYTVGGIDYFGGDRLVWVHDLALLATALDAREWQRLCAFAAQRGIAGVCRNGLLAARDQLGAPVPDTVLADLAEATPASETGSTFLLQSGQAGRAWRNLRALRGTRRKLAFICGNALPSADFLRMKYPAMRRYPLVALHLRRWIEFVPPRPLRHGSRS